MLRVVFEWYKVIEWDMNNAFRYRKCEYSGSKCVLQERGEYFKTILYHALMSYGSREIIINCNHEFGLVPN